MEWKTENHGGTYEVVSQSNGCIFGFYDFVEKADLTSAILMEIQKTEEIQNLEKILDYIELINNH